MQKLIVSDRVPARFPGDFLVAVANGAVASPEEAAYLDRLAKILDGLAAEHGLDRTDAAIDEDRDARYSEAVLKDRDDLRRRVAGELRADAERIALGARSIEEAIDEANIRRATHFVRLRRLTKKLFFVRIHQGDLAVPGGDGRRFAVDLEVVIKDGLPIPENEPGSSKQALFIAIYGALTVIKGVSRDMRRSQAGWRGIFRLLMGDSPDPFRPDRTLDEYVRKLAGIGQLGLSGSQTQLATAALGELKDEFLSQEAGRIKNAYATGLGLRAFGVSMVLLAAYVAIVLGAFPHTQGGRDTFGFEWWSDHTSFFTAGIGAAVGSWLSFSIRNVELTFEQLGSIENDLLNPTLRILFVLGLTLVAYLLFWTGAIGIAVGNLRADVFGFKQSGSVAFLVGILCGLSERALATAISGRSASFVAGLSGAK